MGFIRGNLENIHISAISQKDHPYSETITQRRVKKTGNNVQRNNLQNSMAHRKTKLSKIK